MRRLHLIEIHEQPWCPAGIRDAATDFLQFSAHFGDHYRHVVPALRRAIARSGARRIVDLCSGGGGPWLKLHASVARGTGGVIPVTLTDLHPNREAFGYADWRTGGAVRGWPESVDATQVPAELDGFRTLFGSYHHFRPEAARRVLRDAVAKGQGIGIFDGSRQAWMLLTVLLAPLVVAVVTPFIRPFRPSRLLWTYLVPVVPLVTLFDGVVSCLRSYTPEELRELVDGLGGAGYHWEAGQEPMPRTPFRITYLIGLPGAESEEASPAR